MSYKTVMYGSINVCYLEKLDGGGMALAEDFATQVQHNFGTVDRLFEWCAGPGFIGYSLLARNLCRSLCLADINPEAVDACKATIQLNHLEDKVSAYHADCLDGVPETEQWNLVVGNPPHFNTDRLYPHFGARILYMDEGWVAHRKFYHQVGKHLKSRGSVVVIEHASFSSPESFRSMIEENGLTLLGTRPTRLPSKLYYLWSMKP